MVVGNNTDLGSLKVTPPHLKGMHNCKELLLPYSIVHFCRRQFAALISQGALTLEQHRTNCVPGSITDNREGFSEVWRSQHGRMRKCVLEALKCLLAVGSPFKRDVITRQPC